MLVPTESSSAVLVMIRSKSLSICNCYCATLVDSSRKCAFEGCTQIWCTCMEDSLYLGGQNLHCENLRLMPNISYGGCPSLFWMVSAQFTIKMCIAAWNHEKFTKNPILGIKVIQGHRCWYRRKGHQQCLLWYAASLRLSATVLTLDEPIVVKLRFLRGVPLFDALVRGDFPHSAVPN